MNPPGGQRLRTLYLASLGQLPVRVYSAATTGAHVPESYRRPLKQAHISRDVVCVNRQNWFLKGDVQAKRPLKTS